VRDHRQCGRVENVETSVVPRAKKQDRELVRNAPDTLLLREAEALEGDGILK